MEENLPKHDIDLLPVSSQSLRYLRSDSIVWTRNVNICEHKQNLDYNYSLRGITPDYEFRASCSWSLALTFQVSCSLPIMRCKDHCQSWVPDRLYRDHGNFDLSDGRCERKRKWTQSRELQWLELRDNCVLLSSTSRVEIKFSKWWVWTLPFERRFGTETLSNNMLMQVVLVS